MERYDYLENVKNDLRSWIDENMDYIPKGDTSKAWEYIQDETFISDSVTGNASGSYTFNAWEAEENLCHNLELLAEALSEFGSDAGTYIIEKGAEACDVTIRCYLLSEALNEVMDEYDFEEDDEEEESDDEE